VHRGLARTGGRLRRLLKHRIEPLVLGPTVPLQVAMSIARFDPGGPPGDMAVVTLPLTWGPPWHTTWFHLTGAVPEHWAGRPVVAHVDLGFRGRGDGFQVEGLVWHGEHLRHALQPDRRTVLVTSAATGGEFVDLWVEAASNPVMADDPSDQSYRPTVMGDPATAPHRSLYQLKRADLALLQSEVAHLAREIAVVLDLMADLAPQDPALPWLEQRCEAVIGAVDLADVAGSASRARAELAPVFSRRGAPERHRIVAVGHAHLDTAWLWPVREARRKARRTFANAADLADRYPAHRFAHSQAQHWAWIEQDDPELFRRVVAHVAAGRMEPVGGMWVEADLNLSGGESLVRQFLHGQHAFHRWFGRWCDVGFLPDDFGYPASFPQLLRGAGCQNFFTQKLSWNETNRFPHHTFWWEGLDGSRVLTHFSPIETYNALVMPSQLRFAERNFSDHATSGTSLMCFGHGDGGGGPTADMVERLALLADVDGMPRVGSGTVTDFFAEIEPEVPRSVTWVGEIVLEKHRGTFTSQVATKQGNVACEALLRAAEVWGVATAAPGEQHVRTLWERLLVEQFHDILPGSSIAWVHREAERVHHEVASAAGARIDTCLSGTQRCVANVAPVLVDGVVTLPPVDGDAVPEGVQVCADGSWAARVRVQPLASVPFHEAHRVVAAVPVTAGTQGDGGCWMDNGTLRVMIDAAGRVAQVTDVTTGRRLLRDDAPGARLVLHLDQPAEYDAWDIDEPDARRPWVEVAPAERVELVDAGPLVARVRCVHRTGATTLVHEVALAAQSGRVDHHLVADWHQSEQRLAFVAPVRIGGTRATAGVQFGQVARARHSNTSWQAAHFEQLAHRYVHVGEAHFGAALLFVGPRGVDISHPDRHLALSLLRSPRFPDPGADRGRRTVDWSVAVTRGDPWGDGLTHGLEVEAQRLAHPVHRAGRTVPCLVHHALRGVMVEAIKNSHDEVGDVVVRLWESEGGRVEGALWFELPGREVIEVARCDLLERPLASYGPAPGGAIDVVLEPFEVLSLRLRVRPDSDPK